MGDILSSPTPKKEKKFESGENKIIEYAVCSMQGWRETMEDSHLVALDLGPNKDTHIFGVFDGHGGREVAQYIHDHFVDIFLSTESYKKGMIKMALKETFHSLDNNLLSIEGMKELTIEHKKFLNEFGLMDEQLENDYQRERDYIDNLAFNIGSTCNILVIYKTEFFFANAGDTRCILLRKGEAISMSIDHKPELPNEYSRIRKAGGTIKDGRVNNVINLSRSIGDFMFKQRKDLAADEQVVTCNPDVLYESINIDDDFVIIGCDGIWECITNEGISDLVYHKVRNDPNITLCKILEELFDKSIAKDFTEEKGCDNMTCIIIKIKK